MEFLMQILFFSIILCCFSLFCCCIQSKFHINFSECISHSPYFFGQTLHFFNTFTINSLTIYNVLVSVFCSSHYARLILSHNMSFIGCCLSRKRYTHKHIYCVARINKNFYFISLASSP